MTQPEAGLGEVEEDVGVLLLASGIEADDVRLTGTASTGAMRDTHFVAITTPSRVIDAVVQIRRSPVMAGELLDVHTEAEVLRIARRAGVPVPRVLAAGRTPRPMLVVERVVGESLPRRILRAITTVPGRGDQLAAACAGALASLHAVDPANGPDGLHSLDSQQPAADYTDRLEASLEALPRRHPVLRAGIVWLRSNQPEPPPRLALVHGDFRNGNLIVNDGSLVAVVDWELAHAGDPMEDVAYLCLRCWRYGHDDREVGGFGQLDALRSRYEQAGGSWHEARFNWWTVARTVWWGIGLATQAAAFAAGASDSIVHAASGRRVVELEYDLIRLLETYIR